MLLKKTNWKPNPNDTKQEQKQEGKKKTTNIQNPKTYWIISGDAQKTVWKLVLLYGPHHKKNISKVRKDLQASKHRGLGNMSCEKNLK